MVSNFSIFNYFPPRIEHTFVDWDRYAMGKSAQVIGTDSVSACLAITLYDPKQKTGVLAHISGLDHVSDELRPVNIVDTLIKAMKTKYNLSSVDLEATLSGEGQLPNGFPKNSTIVRRALKSLHIPIIGEDLSRGPSRLVFLDCDSGCVEVYRK